MLSILYCKNNLNLLCFPPFTMFKQEIWNSCIEWATTKSDDFTVWSEELFLNYLCQHSAKTAKSFELHYGKLLWTYYINPCSSLPHRIHHMSHVCLAFRLNICQCDKNAKKSKKKEEAAGVEGKLIEGNQAEPFVFAQFATDYASCKFTTVCVCVCVCVVWHNWIRHFSIIIADIRTSAYVYGLYSCSYSNMACAQTSHNGT